MAENTHDDNGEVRPSRRRFSREYKQNLIAEYEAATSPEERNLMLRREALHSTQINKWQRELRDGTKKTKATKPSGILQENAELAQEVDALKERLALAEEIIEAQGKVWALLHEQSGKSASRKPQK
jgi:transposase